MRKKRKKENMYEKKKRKNVSMSKNKISELLDSLKCIRNFKASRLKDPYSFFQPCAIR
jgi:hypothetical protein